MSEETKKSPIPKPSKEQLEAADAQLSILVLSRGVTIDDKKFWAYIAIPPSKFEAFKAAEEAGGYNIEDYGEIITAGEGDEPPDDVKAQIERDFGAMHDFEERVKAEAEELIKKQQLLDKYSGKKEG